MLFVLLCLAVAPSQQKIISVDYSNGNDTSFKMSDYTFPCKTLHTALEAVGENDTIHIHNGNYSLIDNTNTALTYNDVTITGDGSDVTIVECENGSGFGFINVTNINISGLTLSGCGQLRNSTTANMSSNSVMLFRAALYFENVTNVTIDNVVVSNSIGMGVAMYDVTGNVTVNNSIFRNNSVPSYEVDIYPGGGGFSVEFTYCRPGITMCDDDVTTNSNATYSFLACTFKDNTATSVATKHATFAFGIGTAQFGRGGGLSVFFKGRATGINIIIDSSQFINNHAIWGGGFLSDFLDYSTDNKLTISTSSFWDNFCDYDHSVYAIGTGGGGMRISLHFYNNTVNTCTNHIEVMQCDFTNNTAYYGGGVSFSTSKEDRKCELDHTIQFTQCTWTNNTARTGSGVDLNVHTFPEGHVAPVYFRDCFFISNNNEYVPDEPIYQLGIGSLYSDSIPVDFDGNCAFHYNSASAIAATASTLTFLQNSSLIFSNNTGHHGGAISLLGNAYMLVENNTSLEFYYNRATAKGGAIYYLAPSERDFVSTRKCFVNYKNLSVSPYHWNTSFKFRGNDAPGSSNGNSIFVTTLLPCIWEVQPGQTNVNNSLIYEVLYWNGTFDYGHSSLLDEISTEPLNVKRPHMDVEISPGELYDLKLNPLNDKMDNTTALYLVQTNNNGVTVDNTSTYTSSGAIQLKGRPQTVFDIELQTVGVRPLLVKIQGKLGDCPPGYYYDSRGTCKCSVYTDQSYHGITRCDDQENNLVAYMLPHIWAGYEGKELVTGDCPENYCFKNNSVYSDLIALPPNSSGDSLNELLCKPKSRTGRVCGMCLEGHYVFINSQTYDCGKCDNTLSKYGYLFIILLKYIPMTAFLCVIMFFNISLVDGPLNAFILFTQILPAADLYAAGAIKPSQKQYENFLIKSYEFVYGFWNLDYLETLTDPFCTFKYRGVLPILVLEYMSASYPLILFLLFFSILPWLLGKLATSQINCVRNCILSLQRRCIRLRSSWSVKNSIIHGLITFLVLSYVKFTSVSWHILAYGVVRGSGGEHSNITVKVAWVDGTKPYLGEVHGYYAAAAFVVLVCFVVSAPLFLLSYPYLPKLLNKLKLDEKWIVQKLLLRPLAHAIPFFDVIQGCFKDEYRCFAAFYFAYRVIAWAIFSFTTTVAEHYLWQLAFYTFILCLHSFCQPYKKKWHNVLDSFIFSLLILINIISFYRYSEFVQVLSKAQKSFWFQLFFIYCPLFYFVMYVLIHCILKWCHPRVITVVRQLSRRDGYQVFETHNEDSAEFPARLLDSCENAELKNSTEWNNKIPVLNNVAAAATSECPSTIQNYGSTESTS